MLPPSVLTLPSKVRLPPVFATAEVLICTLPPLVAMVPGSVIDEPFSWTLPPAGSVMAPITDELGDVKLKVSPTLPPVKLAMAENLITVLRVPVSEPVMDQVLAWPAGAIKKGVGAAAPHEGEAGQCRQRRVGEQAQIDDVVGRTADELAPI